MFIKRPSPKSRRNKKYSLIGDDGKVVRDARIDALNKDLGAGVGIDIIEKRMQRILRGYKPEAPKHDLLDVNEKLARAVLAKSLLRRPNMAYPKGQLLRLLAAARYMTPLVIQDAPEDALLARLVASPHRYEYTCRVNQMLRHLGRPVLPNPKDKKAPPEFISVAFFLEQASELAPEHRAFLGALFATGCRMAELPEVSFKDSYQRADIVSQWHVRRRAVWDTKNKKERTAPTLPALRIYIKEFLLLPKDLRRSLCVAGYKNMRQDCRRVLGCRIHDLRHSYCVALAEAGFTSHQIARYIGDTVETTERHYRNWLATDEELLSALKKLA